MALQRPTTEPFTELKLVTPDLARAWLLHNKANRPLRPGLVRMFSEALRQNRVATTHQGIAFDLNGNLQDGQHRLTAIVETGVSWLMQVSYNMPVDNFHLIDRGANRTVGDLMDIRGFKNATHLAAVAKLAFCWELGRASFSGLFRDDQLAVLVGRYPALEDATVVRKTELGIPPAALSFMAFIANDDVFVEDLTSDMPDVERPGGMLATIYRDRFQARKARDYRLSFSLMVKARNDHAVNVSPTRKYSQRSAEAFPTPGWNPPIRFGQRVEEDEGD